jgi:hypothetical protein
MTDAEREELLDEISAAIRVHPDNFGEMSFEERLDYYGYDDATKEWWLAHPEATYQEMREAMRDKGRDN